MYKQLLNENNSNLLKKLLNADMCKLDADTLLKKCLIEPIESLLNSHTFSFQYFFVIIDGLEMNHPKQRQEEAEEEEVADDEDEYNSSNHLMSFLLKHMNLFPKWFKFLITTRDESAFVERLKTSCHVISLDPKATCVSSSRAANSSSINDSHDYRSSIG